MTSRCDGDNHLIQNISSSLCQGQEFRYKIFMRHGFSYEKYFIFEEDDIMGFSAANTSIINAYRANPSDS